MGMVLRSTNAQVAFRPLGALGRMAGVVYDGPPVQSAVVVFSGEVVELAGAIVRGFGHSLRLGTVVVSLVTFDGFVVPGGLGFRARFGGVVVLDLNPGDVLSLMCTIEDGAEYEFAANGLTIVVL